MAVNKSSLAAVQPGSLWTLTVCNELLWLGSRLIGLCNDITKGLFTVYLLSPSEFKVN